MPNNATITLPCGHELPAAEILRLAGSIRSAMRKTRGAGPGKPRTAPRCPCGAMTVKRAEQRGHRC